MLWVASVALAGGYDPRFIGVGSDEFRRVINAAVSLTAMVAIASYAVKFDLARGYVVIALPCVDRLRPGRPAPAAQAAAPAAQPRAPACAGWWRWGTPPRWPT